MTKSERLLLLKLDLQMQTEAFDQYLTHLLDTAEQLIEREGIRLEDTVEDEHIRIMYAAYLYRKRAEDDPVMPRMLRYALNNRLFGQKGAENDAAG